MAGGLPLAADLPDPLLDMAKQTLYDKLWAAHLVHERDDGAALIYIDRHLLHEVTSPQAFEGLRHAGRRPWRAAACLAMVDHAIPTESAQRGSGTAGIRDDLSRIQVKALDDNCADFGIEQFSLDDPRQGIVHVVGPELGVVLPGMTVVCGDSHTSTHGALGVLAVGIGTSEVEHVLATQCLLQQKMRSMLVRFDGALGDGVSAKDLALALIGHGGAALGVGYALEFAGETVSALSVEGRMTLCNMAVEAGARCGLVAVDQHTLDYVRQRPLAPSGELWERAERAWRELHSDDGAVYAAELSLDASAIVPQVSWGTSPDMVGPIDGAVPDPAREAEPKRRAQLERALAYMDLEPDRPFAEIPVDTVFIGSCSNARIEDLRAAAGVLRGRRRHPSLQRALVVPGSGQVRRQAEAEGLAQTFIDAGLEWREAGCSMCLGMNDDNQAPGARCASTSNRNFEGRQGFGVRTHLLSPAMAAAAAVSGRLADVRELL